jgi:hypothetical protein
MVEAAAATGLVAGTTGLVWLEGEISWWSLVTGKVI